MASEGSNEAAVAQPAENDQKENNLVRNAGTVGQDARGAASPGGAATDGVVEFDEESALRNLTENVRDQDELERDITYQANLALIEAEDKKDKKRIEKAEANKVKLESQKKTQQQKLRGALGNPSLKLRIQQEISRIDSEIELVENDIVDFNTRIEQRHADEGEHEVTSGGNKKLPNETQREFLIRTGKITPFAKFGGPRPEGVEGGLANAVIDAEDEAVAQELEEEQGNDQPRSHQNLRLPGFTEEADYPISAVESEFSLRRRKKRKVQVEPASSDDFNPSGASDAPSPSSSVSAGSTVLSDDDLDRKRRRKKPAKAEASAEEKVDFSRIDDGDESLYQQRLSDWVDRRKRARQRRQQRLGEQVTDDAEEEEWFKPSPDQPDHYFENGLKLPGDIYPSLFDYQKTGVQWLAELYAQRVGGIVGDEMGLGKTGNPLLTMQVIPWI
jgi:DNA excision repair protein ERCC-6